MLLIALISLLQPARPFVLRLSVSFCFPPIPILGLGLVGFKQELHNSQVSARVGYKF